MHARKKHMGNTATKHAIPTARTQTKHDHEPNINQQNASTHRTKNQSLRICQTNPRSKSRPVSDLIRHQETKAQTNDPNIAELKDMASALKAPPPSQQETKAIIRERMQKCGLHPEPGNPKNRNPAAKTDNKTGATGPPGRQQTNPERHQTPSETTRPDASKPPNTLTPTAFSSKPIPSFGTDCRIHSPRCRKEKS
jgi:hypothetical protein